MTLPSTGGTWTEVIAPGLNPNAVRYAQTVDVLMGDYLDVNGVPNNWADPACGLGIKGFFTPFAVDGSIRNDLLYGSNSGANQGLFLAGLLKEDSTSQTPNQTVQQTPSSQYVRTVRDVLTKLDDQLEFEPIETTDLINQLRWELPLAGWTPSDGQAGYQLARGNTDFLVERRTVVLSTDGDGQLIADVYPRIVTNKKGKLNQGRKAPRSLQLTYDVLPDPITGKSMWTCESGIAWDAESATPQFLGVPVATPVTGLKATISFITPTGGTKPYTFTVTQQAGGTGSFTSSTLSGSPVVAGAMTTVTATGLTATTAYEFKVTVTDANSATSTATPTASITSTAS